MADIIFKCSTCEQVIAVDEVGAGRSLACPKCKTEIKVPDPECRFECPDCAVELATGFGLGAAAKAVLSFNCPSCQNSITLQSESSVDTDDKNFTAADDREETVPEILATCPKCDRDDVPFVCPNCQRATGGMTLQEDDTVLCFCGIVTDRIACPHCNAIIMGKLFHTELETSAPFSLKSSLRLRNSASEADSTSNTPSAIGGHSVCNYCATPRKPDDVLCVKCGMNFQTGKRLGMNWDENDEERSSVSGQSRMRTTGGGPGQIVSFVKALAGIALLIGIIVWAISVYQDNVAASKRTSQQRVAAESRSPPTPPSRSSVSASATQSTSTSRQGISEREREPQRSQTRSPDERARQEQDRRALQQRRVDELRRYMAATYNPEARVFERQYDADREAIQFNRVEKSFVDKRNMAISLWNEYGMAGAPHPGPPVTFHIARVRFDPNSGLWVVYHEELATY